MGLVDVAAVVVDAAPSIEAEVSTVDVTTVAAVVVSAVAVAAAAVFVTATDDSRVLNLRRAIMGGATADADARGSPLLFCTTDMDTKKNAALANRVKRLRPPLFSRLIILGGCIFDII